MINKNNHPASFNVKEIESKPIPTTDLIILNAILKSLKDASFFDESISCNF